MLVPTDIPPNAGQNLNPEWLSPGALKLHPGTEFSLADVGNLIDSFVVRPIHLLI